MFDSKKVILGLLAMMMGSAFAAASDSSEIEDAVPIAFGEIQASSDYTSWAVVLPYSLSEEAEPLESSDVVVLVGDLPETLAESNIVPKIDENGISFGMTDCPNGKTYYWQVKCNVNYMGASKEWSSEGEIKTKILATFIPGKTNFLNSESWGIGAVPNDKYTDIHIDGDDEKNTVAKLESSSTIYVTNGVLKVDAGDSVTVNVTKNDTGCSIYWYAVSIDNFGMVSLSGAKKNNQGISLSAIEKAFFNGPRATLRLDNTNWPTGDRSMSLLLNMSKNEGIISVSSTGKKYSNARLKLYGAGCLQNDGLIDVYVVGGYHKNAGASEINFVDASGDVVINGTGMIRLDKDRRNIDGNQTVNVFGSVTDSAFKTRIINSISHSILGNGKIDNCHIYNQGLLGSLGTNDYLNIACEYYGGSKNIMTNDVTGRIVAGYGKGIRFLVKCRSIIGKEVKTRDNPGYNSRFVNLGLIESRTGSEIYFDKGINSSSETTGKNNISLNSNPLELWGTVAGGGLFKTERTMCIGDGAILSPGDLANTNGTGVSTCGTLTFSSNLVLREPAAIPDSEETTSGAITEFQCRKPEAGKYDSVWVNGDATVAGTLRFLRQPKAGTYPLFTSTGTLTCDLSALKIDLAEGVKAPKLRLNTAATYTVEEPVLDEESGEPVLDEETGLPKTQTVEMPCQRLEATWVGGFTVFVR